MTSEQFVQYLIDGITTGSIFALIGLGFTIICSVTNIINFAQGHLTMLGGMISYMAVLERAYGSNPDWNVSRSRTTV